MKHSLFLSLCAVVLAIVGRSAVQADGIHLFLEYDAQCTNAWELFAQTQLPGTAGSNSGEFGIAGFTTQIYDIDFGTNGDAITFAPGINAIFPDGGTPALDLGGGLTQLLYGQDISDALSVVGGIGSDPNAPTLIASGTFSTLDPNGVIITPTFDALGGSAGNFLSAAAPGTQGPALLAATAGFEVDAAIHFGDINNDGVVDSLDIQPFVTILQTGPSLYDVRADMDPVCVPNGVVDGLDIEPFVFILQFGTLPPPLSAGISAVPEPSSLALLMVAGFFGLGRGKRS